MPNLLFRSRFSDAIIFFSRGPISMNSKMNITAIKADINPENK